MTPAVSILLPVRNGEMFLESALESLKAQTLRDFEVLVFDNGSEDRTPEILSAVGDSRFRVIRSETNEGIARSMNQGLNLATSHLVARMDADDRCVPRRLERQVEAFQRDSTLTICGSWARFESEKGYYHHRPPTTADQIQSLLLFQNPLVHSTVMMNRDHLSEQTLRYDETLTAAQDLDLWYRSAEKVKIQNLPEVLVEYRVHAGNVSHTRRAASQAVLMAVLRRGLEKLGLDPSHEELSRHAQWGHGSGADSLETLVSAGRWFQHLSALNTTHSTYPTEAFQQVLAWCWHRIGLNSAHLGLPGFKVWRNYATLWSPPPNRHGWMEIVAVMSLAPFRGVSQPTGTLEICT